MRGSGSAKLGFTSPEGFDAFQHHSLGLEIHQDGLNKKPGPLALIWGSSHYQRNFSSPRGPANDSRSPVPSFVRCCCVTWQNRYSCGCAEAPTCFSAPGRRNAFTQMESGTRRLSLRLPRSSSSLPQAWAPVKDKLLLLTEAGQVSFTRHASRWKRWD